MSLALDDERDSRLLLSSTVYAAITAHAVKATRFHRFDEDLGNFLAERAMGLVIEETGGGFKNKTLDYIVNRVSIAAIRRSMVGLPLRQGLDY
jgi:hypothetical protein